MNKSRETRCLNCGCDSPCGCAEPMPPADIILSAIVGGSATERDFNIDLRGRKVIGHLKLAWRWLPDLPRRKAGGQE